MLVPRWKIALSLKENVMVIGFMRLKRRVWDISTIILFAVVFLALSSVKDVFAEPLRVGVTSNVHSSLIYLAESQKLFKKEGIDIIIKKYELGPSAIEDLTANRLDIAAAAEFVFVLKMFKYPDIRMLATICTVSNHDIVVRKDHGIAQPGDLEGKRVAIPRGTSAEFFLYNYLIFNRIPAESVQVAYQTPSQMVKAIAEGTIDAALTWAPHPTQMMNVLGSKGERWPAQSGQNSFVALYAMSPFLKKQPKLMEQFLSALSKSEALLAKNPEQAQAIVRHSLKSPSGAFLEAWSRSHIQLQLTQDLIILMEREAKWAIRNGLIQEKEIPNYLDFFYFDGLDKVKPEAVSIVH
jgi:NitT/TauT family transport system substrate-binding protein